MPPASLSLTAFPTTALFSLRRSRVLLFLLLGFWLLIYAPGLFHPALLDDADSVHAEAAKEMMLSGDLVTLHANGIRYLEKAPLMYWAMAGSFKIFGVHEWAARLPLTIGVLALWLVVFRWGTHLYGVHGGFYAALILATSFGPYIFTRILIPDMLVGLWIVLSLMFFLHTLDAKAPSRIACWGLAASCGLNVLTKGLIGIVFPLGTILVYLLWTDNLRHLLRLRLISSTIVFLLIAAPWHIAAGLANPDQGSVRGFFWFYFVNEHFLRYLNRRVPRDYDTVPLHFFWGLLLVWLMPWSAYLFQPLRQVRSLWLGRRLLNARQRGDLLFGICILLILVFFSFSTRQEYYLLPALPAAALLIGGWLAREEEEEEEKEDEEREEGKGRRGGSRWAAAFLVIGVAAALAAIATTIFSEVPPASYDIADLLQKHPEQYALSFGHFFDLDRRALGAFRAPLLTTGTALLAGSFIGWWLRRKRMFFQANLALAVMMIPVLYSAHEGLLIFEPVLSSKVLAHAIKNDMEPGDVVEINGEYEEGSTLNFYIGRQVRILNGRSANLWYGSQFPDAPRIFDDDASFGPLWEGTQRVYLFTAEDKIPKYVVRRGVPLKKYGGKIVLTNFLPAH